MLQRWRTLAKTTVADILQWVADASAAGQVVHVGTDSLQTGRHTQFVTVVVIHTPTHGGRVAYTREVVPRITSLRDRLMKEVWRSVELGMQLSPYVKGQLNIHIDANVDPQYSSAKYAQELAGLVMAQGFRAILKPDAWAASHCADHIVRFHGKYPKAS